MANKKPKFEDLPESTFGDMRRPVQTLRAQSEESKVIKRVNEQMKQLTNFIPPDDNNYFAAYKRALDKSGVEYVRKTDANGVDRYVIRNTKANQQKVDDLRRELDRQKARSMREIRQEVIQEVKQAGKKATKQEIDERLKFKKAYSELESNAEFVYSREGKSGSGKMSKILDKMRGYKRGEDPRGYERLVYELSQEVKKARAAERRQATAASKKKLDPNLPY